MTVKTYYPSTVTQNSAAWIASFTTLNNVKNSNNDYAYAAVQGKSQTKHTPAKITATHFNINIPEGAVINKITVQYKQRKMPNNGTYPNLPAPKITLANTAASTMAGTTPNSTAQVCEKEFKFSPNRANVNSNNFGVVLEYQKNLNESSGELWVYWIRVIVDYTETKYTINTKVLSGQYNHDVYHVETTLTNTNNTTYTPTVTISAPLGFSFKELVSNGGGTFTQINNRTFTWKPPFKKGVSNLAIEIAYDTDITYATGETTVTRTYSVSESLNETSKDTNITIIKERSTPSPDDPDVPVSPSSPGSTEMDIPAVVLPEFNQWCEYTFKIPSELLIEYSSFQLVCFDIIFDESSYAYNFTADDLTQDNTITIPIKAENYVYGEIELYSNNTKLATYPFYVATDFVTPPNFSLLEITGEELNRFGDGIPYTVQSDWELDTTEEYYIPIEKNYKLGIFNNPIEANITRTETTDPETGEIVETVTDSTDYTSLTPSEILENAEYWSNFLPNVNVSRSMECKFIYNKNYPLFLIITGDYPSFSRNDDSLTFNTPCIVETENFNQRIQSAPFFTPIQDIITEDISSITLDAYQYGSSFKLYGTDFDENFGTGENITIRGIEVIGDISCNNDASITAKLQSPTGEVGARSTLINQGTESLSVGGIGDLFGYLPTDLTNLKDWVVEIETSNVFTEPVDITITNLQLKVYYISIEKQVVSCYIDGEDLAFYGAFITDLNVPAGLKTSTSLLGIDGTDTNYAYRQNVREKEITLKLDVGDCNLLDSTNQLKQLTQLIVNEKDQYNRPIPKKIQFSNYPDLYWEYIIVDSFDTDLDISTYSLDVKLTVPSGTAFNVNDTMVNNAGYVQGLVSVNPIITIKPLATTVTLTEEESNQKFIISYSEYEEDDLYIIDCENRTVNIRKTNAANDNDDVDISSYVDFNSDWFVINNDFLFNGLNCMIQTVQYTERW